MRFYYYDRCLRPNNWPHTSCKAKTVTEARHANNRLACGGRIADHVELPVTLDDRYYVASGCQFFRNARCSMLSNTMTDNGGEELLVKHDPTRDPRLCKLFFYILLLRILKEFTAAAGTDYPRRTWTFRAIKLLSIVKTTHYTTQNWYASNLIDSKSSFKIVCTDKD